MSNLLSIAIALNLSDNAQEPQILDAIKSLVENEITLNSKCIEQDTLLKAMKEQSDGLQLKCDKLEEDLKNANVLIEQLSERPAPTTIKVQMETSEGGKKQKWNVEFLYPEFIYRGTTYKSVEACKNAELIQELIDIKAGVIVVTPA